MTAAAHLTSNTGWMSYDCGGFGLAHAYMTQALRLCTENNERVLAGQVFAGMAHLAVTTGHAAEAVNLAEVGLATTASAGSPLGAMRLHAMRARAHAALGESRAAVAAIGKAQEAIARSGAPEDQPRWVRYLDQAYLTAEMAHCFSALGDRRNAERHARDAVDGTSGRGRRRALSLTVLATAQLAGRERDLDAAVGTADQALDLLQEVSSARGVAAVRAFQASLAPYSGEESVRRFTARARELRPAA
ncbi:hypothetical protein [Pilimelia anulata]|uniref:hypothetical protein n=1 Tax=Pilimelia anulata TaxID=53371 RepID=UPI001665F614|nr:hypothetical protein [Pilimelia anulata]